MNLRTAGRRAACAAALLLAHTAQADYLWLQPEGGSARVYAGELGKRQIFSGIRGSYAEPEKLVGRSVVFIANLAPRKMRFGLSEGMILSAGFDGGALALLDADAGALPGMPVR